jgi:predicted transglutaminase-like cysteine proteinase
MALLMLLEKNKDLIHIGISLQHLQIVTASQNGDSSIGILPA